MAGATSVYAPKRAPYTYTQGDFLLCRMGGDADTDLRLTSISYNERLKPISVTPVLRSIPPASQRTGDKSDWDPISTAIGKPGAFAHEHVAGAYSSKIDGAQVAPTCHHRYEPGAAALELQLVITVPKAGSDIDGFRIAYTVDGHDRTLNVPWRTVGCGTRTPKRMCSG